MSGWSRWVEDLDMTGVEHGADLADGQRAAQIQVRGLEALAQRRVVRGAGAYTRSQFSST